MANGYGYNVSSSSARQSRTNAQGQTAPPGFHYMPDGTLMSDAEHNRLYGSSDKVISSFDLDFSDLPSISSFRNFSIQGDKGAQFTLEIKDKDTGKYYNFITNTFQTEQTKLKMDADQAKYYQDQDFNMNALQDYWGGFGLGGVSSQGGQANMYNPTMGAAMGAMGGWGFGKQNPNWMSNFSNIMPSWGGGGMTYASNPNSRPFNQGGYYDTNYFQPY